MLHFRFTFALLGCAALLTGALLELNWLAAPGCVASAISEVIGMAQARARFPLPADRALRGSAEGLPALGVTAYEPAAIGITVAVVLYALMANGIQTVSLSRGSNLPLTGSETLRRVLTSAAGMLVLGIPLAATSFPGVHDGMQLSSWQLAGVGFLMAAAAGSASLAIMWWSVRATRPAPNVDT